MKTRNPNIKSTVVTIEDFGKPIGRLSGIEIPVSFMDGSRGHIISEPYFYELQEQTNIAKHIPNFIPGERYLVTVEYENIKKTYKRVDWRIKQAVERMPNDILWKYIVSFVSNEAEGEEYPIEKCFNIPFNDYQSALWKYRELCNLGYPHTRYVSLKQRDAYLAVFSPMISEDHIAFTYHVENSEYGYPYMKREEMRVSKDTVMDIKGL